MTNLLPERYGPDDATERRILASLPWTGSKQAAYCLDKANPIEKVRSEMRRVYGAEMRGFDAELVGLEIRKRETAAREAAAQRGPVVTPADRAHAAQQDALDYAFGIGDYAPGKVGNVVNRGNVQFFGNPNRGGN